MKITVSLTAAEANSALVVAMEARMGCGVEAVTVESEKPLTLPVMMACIAAAWAEARNGKIPAIKAVRTIHPFGLAEAKNFVEAVWNSYNAPGYDGGM